MSVTAAATPEVPRSRLLAGTAVASILVYLAGSPFYLVGSLTIGDLWMIAALPAVLLSDTATRGVLRLLGGAYGRIALVLSAAMLTATLHATHVVHALSFVGQLLYTVWIVIPVIAAGVADLQSPFQFLRRLGVAYLLFYAVGLVLLFGRGSDAILYQSAIGRIFQRFTTLSAQLALMALGAAGTAFAARRRAGYAVLLALSLIPILFNASRTGLVAFGLLAALALTGSIRDRRQLMIVLMGGALLTGLGYFITNTKVVQDLWQIRVLSASGFLEDEIRIASIRASVEAIRRSLPTLFFGAGWGSSGDEIVVHNLVIQVTHEGGLFVLLSLSALLGLPAAWVLGVRGADRMARHFVIMLIGVFVLYWLLNALSVERPYWLAYAIALGIAQRPRLGRPPDATTTVAMRGGLASAPAFS